jgi:eukaryotic-like serine/threonine-protein kinase
MIAASGLLLIFGAAFGTWQRAHARKLTEKDIIIVSNFVNRTGDPVFDSTLSLALTTQLENSPFLRIISQERLQEVLRLIGRSPADPVTRDVARAICVREPLKAMVEGDISSIGSHYLVSVDAVACATGESLGREQEEAPNKERVLAALAIASTRLRSHLGESLPATKTPPAAAGDFSRVTTASLEAYKQFAEGETALRAGQESNAVPFYLRAIELDPHMAMAYARIGTYNTNLSELAKAKEYLTKAYTLRDRVSEHERLYIEGHYFQTVVGDLRKAVDVYQQYRQRFPRDWTPVSNMGNQYLTMGDFEKGEASNRDAINLEPKAWRAYSNLARALAFEGKTQEAISILHQAILNGIDISPIRSAMLFVAYMQGDLAEVKRQEDWLRPKVPGSPGVVEAALWNMWHGRLRKADELASLALAELPNDRPTEAATLSLLVWRYRILVGECRPPTPAVQRELGSYRGSDVDILVLVAFPLALCGDAARAEKLLHEIHEQYPEGTLQNGVYIPAIPAAIHLKAHRPEQAIEELKPAIPFERADFCPIYVRALAYLQMKSVPEAAAEFQKLTDRRYGTYGMEAVGYSGLARARMLSGDQAGARKAYEDFFAFWKDADPDIPLLIQARKEYAALQ